MGWQTRRNIRNGTRRRGERRDQPSNGRDERLRAFISADVRAGNHLCQRNRDTARDRSSPPRALDDR